MKFSKQFIEEFKEFIDNYSKVVADFDLWIEELVKIYLKENAED